MQNTERSGYNARMLKTMLINLLIMAGIVCFALIFVFVFGNSIDLKCLRQQQGITCQIRKELFGRIPISSRIVTNVTEVQNEGDCSGEDGCSYRPVLVTSSGDSVPVNDVYTDEGPVTQQVAQIRNFIESNDPNFELKLDAAWWVIILIGGLGLMGLIIVFFSMISTIIKSMSGRSY
jgi:hypothetical protein